MVAFSEERFPVTISFQSSGGPEYITQIVRTGSGAEERTQVHAFPLHRFQATIDVRKEDQMDDARNFFWSRRGRFQAFRWKDWNDFRSDIADTPTPVNIGTGNGSNKVFQLFKRYNIGSSDEQIRNIKKPGVQGTASAPDTTQGELLLEVFVDGVLQTIITDYAIDETTGIITFTVAPGSTLPVTANFSFDVPVRFDTDILEITKEFHEVESWVGIPLVEIKI